MPETSINIRVMRREELDLAMDWLAREGWNPGLRDGECFWQEDPDGFFIGVLNRIPVVMGALGRMGERHGVIRFVIVHERFRHRGFGRQMMQHLLSQMTGRTIAVEAQDHCLPAYEDAGFRASWRTVRYGKTWENVPRQWREVDVQPLAQTTRPLLVYDKNVTTIDRENLLDCWLSRQGSRAFLSQHGGLVKGYGVVRACRQGYRIGPLFADSPGIAEALFQRLVSVVPPNESIQMDIPDRNKPALALAHKYEMQPLASTTRLYLPEAPNDLAPPKWYASTSPIAD